MTESGTGLTQALSDRYEIEAELGRGGMATVYLAADVKHGRKVAVKVLRPELSLAADRFLREIRVTAGLQHPGIVPLFDSGEAGGFVYYVMPYVEGESLRDRLERDKRLPLDEAVRIAREVADALQYAHEHGIVHRDIKPENILLHGGHAMVADFGIALAVSAAAGGRMTETGLSLGTPHYMSPEQATADRQITARSDIYSLASVLYEMLAGEPPHLGGSAQQIIMKIVTEEAAPVDRIRKAVPPNVAVAVARALEKLPADRFDTAKTFADALMNPAFAPAAAAVTTGRSAVAPSRHSTFVLAVAAILAAALALWGWLRPPPPAPITAREIVLGSIGTFPGTIAQAAIAPDGSAIVYLDTSAVGTFQLMLKERDELAPRVLAAVAVARPGPTFSPDGQWIAFADGKLQRVARGGGVPVVLSDSLILGSTAWLDNGTIVSMEPGGQGLLATPADGGVTRRVHTADSIGTNFVRVAAVPGAEAVVVVAAVAGATRIVALDLRTGGAHDLQLEAENAWIVGRWLLYARRNGALYGAPFDAGRLAVSGASTALLDSIQMNTMPQSNEEGDVTIGADGTLLYVRRSPMATEPGMRLTRVSLDGTGTSTRLPGTILPSTLGGLDVSRDGRRVALALTDPASGRNDIHVVDLATGSLARLTFAGTSNTRPQWSPDGARVMFVSDAGGALQLWAARADGSGTAEIVVRDRGAWGGEWSPDGRWIVYRTDQATGGSRDIYAIRTSGDTARVGIATTTANELAPAISPDGRWLAFTSDAGGTDQVYVRPFPESDAAVWQVSPGGGTAPRWSHDGRRIFYQTEQGQMMAADVSTVPTFSVLRTSVLFKDRSYFNYRFYHVYAVAPDDRSFLMFAMPAAALGHGARLVQVENWLPAALEGAR